MSGSEPLRPCCAGFAKAIRMGTDNEMFVRREEDFLGKLADGIPDGPDCYGIRSAADSLREAREGRE